MKKFLLVLFVVVLAACVSPEESGVKVIVGAKLDPGPGRAPVDYSVVVIPAENFEAVGPQSSTPVPIGAKMTSGMGMTIEPLPGGDPIEAGQPANLVLKGRATGSCAAASGSKHGDPAASPSSARRWSFTTSRPWASPSAICRFTPRKTGAAAE